MKSKGANPNKTPVHVPTYNSILKWGEYLVARNYSPNTIDNYICQLRHATKLGGIEDPVEFTQRLRNTGMNTNSIRAYIHALKNYYTWATYKGLATTNIYKDYKIIGQKQILFHKTLTIKEFYEILEKISNENLKIAMLTMFHTGLRISELCRLKCHDIDFTNKKIRVHNGKGRKDRVVYLSDNTSQILYNLFKNKNENDNVITGRYNLPIKNPTLEKWFADARRAGEIPIDITPHSLRHSYASILYEQCKNIAIVRDQLGHSSLNTTSIYLHATDEQRSKEIMDLNI